PGEHDDAAVVAPADFRGQVEAVSVGQPDVEDDGRRQWVVGQRRAHFPGSAGHCDLETAQFETVSEILAQARLVLDDQDSGHAGTLSKRGSRSSSAGNGTRTIAAVPPSARGSRSSVAPW